MQPFSTVFFSQPIVSGVEADTATLVYIVPRLPLSMQFHTLNKSRGLYNTRFRAAGCR